MRLVGAVNGLEVAVDDERQTVVLANWAPDGEPVYLGPEEHEELVGLLARAVHELRHVAVDESGVGR